MEQELREGSRALERGDGDATSAAGVEFKRAEERDAEHV